MKKNILIICVVIFAFCIGVIFYRSVRINSIQSEEHTSDALKALQFLTRCRTYPEQGISSGKYFSEFQRSRRSLKKSNDENTIWETMGPYNVPGRMIGVALNPQNPNTLYAGSASGGLWRTCTAETGGNWERIQTGYPVLGVMGLAIDPTDSNTIYIGTGEVYDYQESDGGLVVRLTRGSYGIGILKSTDNGETWEHVLDWSQNQERGVQCIRINPQNPRTLYAATTEGIYKSTDAGDSWHLVLEALMGEDIVIHAVDTSKVMVSCGNFGSTGAGIYYSTNGGENWIQSPDIPYYTGKTLLDMYASNPDVVFASVAHSENGIGLYRTDDFGQNWTQVHANADVVTYQGFFSHWVAVHPLDDSQIVHAGVQIYKSNNGGVQLTAVGGPHVDHHNFTHHPTDPNTIYIVCDGGVYRSTNFGNSYQNVGYGLQTAQFYNGFSCSSSDSMLAMGGLQDNSTVIYYGTCNWTTRIGGDGAWTATNPQNDSILYGEQQNNRIHKSINRGITFTLSTTAMMGSGAAFIAPFIVSPSHPSILYSGRRQVYRTNDSGDWWSVTNSGTQLDGNSVISMAISHTNPNIVYAGTAPFYTRAHIYRTQNGGTSWANMTQTLPDRYPMDLAVDPNDDEIVYVVFGGYGSGHVYKSLDEGENWEDITRDLPDVPTLSLVVDPKNSDHVYVGNDLGVYVSTDGGMNWETYQTGLPEVVMAMDLTISPSNRNLRVATHGNGAYQRPLLYTLPFLFLTALDSIPDELVVGTPVAFSGTITNTGNETQTDSCTLQIRIIKNPYTLVYSNSIAIQNLQAGESRSFTFDESFTPQEAGNYSVEFTQPYRNFLKGYFTTEQTLIVISGPTSVGDQEQLPTDVILYQNYPNPCNPATTIQYDLSTSCYVDLRIYDMGGREVKSLVSERQTGGRKTVHWGGKDNNGLNVGSGMYLYRLKANHTIQSQKMMLMR